MRPSQRFCAIVRPSLDFCCSTSSLDTKTCPYFDNLKFDTFDADGPQCHFITSVLRAGKFHTSTDTLVPNFLLVF